MERDKTRANRKDTNAREKECVGNPAWAVLGISIEGNKITAMRQVRIPLHQASRNLEDTKTMTNNNVRKLSTQSHPSLPRRKRALISVHIMNLPGRITFSS